MNDYLQKIRKQTVKKLLLRKNVLPQRPLL